MIPVEMIKAGDLLVTTFANANNAFGLVLERYNEYYEGDCDEDDVIEDMLAIYWFEQNEVVYEAADSFEGSSSWELIVGG